MLNKLDLVPDEERAARVKDFVKRFKHKGPVFEISALTREGCERAGQGDLPAREGGAGGGATAGRRRSALRRRATDAHELPTVLRDARRIVVKVGSSLVTNEGRGLDEAAIGEWCRQLARAGARTAAR